MGNLDRSQQGEGDSGLRRLLTQAIRSCPLSRVEICEALTRRLGLKVTPFMLDSYTAESKKPARFPAAFVAAFCEVTGSDQLQRHLLGARLRELLELGDRTVEWAWSVRRVRQELAKLDGQGQKRSRKTRRG